MDWQRSVAQGRQARARKLYVLRLVGLCVALGVPSPSFAAAADAAKRPKTLSSGTSALGGAEVYERALPSVFTLKVKGADGSTSTGTGFLAVKDGLALTAWHTVRNIASATGTFSDGEEYELSGLVDKDEKRDLALVRIKAVGRPLLTLAGSGDPRVGAAAFVIGAPRGLEFSISDGVIAQVRTVEGTKEYQFTCPASPGNSGGPLLNDQGEVTGVVSWQVRSGQNLNFAVPARYALGLDSTLPTTPWAAVKSSTLNATVAAERGDEVLQDAMAAVHDWNVVLSQVLADNVELAGGFKQPLPPSFFQITARLERSALALSSTPQSEMLRARASAELTESVVALLKSADKLKTALDLAYHRGGWSRQANELVAEAVALARGDEDRNRGVRRLLDDQGFVDSAPGWFKDWVACHKMDPKLGVWAQSHDQLSITVVRRDGYARAWFMRPGDRFESVDGVEVKDCASMKRELTSRRERGFELRFKRDGQVQVLKIGPDMKVASGGRPARPPPPPGLKPTKTVGERCIWDEECETGVCPYDRCLPKRQ